MQSIYKEFSNVVRERKKDFAGPFHKLYGISTGLSTMMNKNDIFNSLLLHNNANNNDNTNATEEKQQKEKEHLM